jgi:hypothetical protein
MKHAFFLFFLIMLVSCGPGVQIINYNDRDYTIGERKEAFVGREMLTYEYGAYRSSYGPSVKAGQRWQLEYAGVLKGVIQIKYREYSLSPESTLYGYTTAVYARPAYNQDLTYDISETKIIRFKDVRLEIHSADQEKIVFTVLEAP